MPQIPLFPLGTVLMPGARLQLRIFEPRYLTMLRDLIRDPEDVRRFGVVAIRAGVEVGTDQATDLYGVGCSAVLERLAPMDHSTYGLVARGQRRFSLDAVDSSAGTLYPTADITWLAERTGNSDRVQSSARRLRTLLVDYWRVLGVGDLTADDLDRDPHLLSYQVDEVMVLDVGDRHRLLAAETTEERLSVALRLLRRETELVSQLGAVPHRPDRGPTNLN